MSERYGDCIKCKGHGFIVTPQADALCLWLEIECPRCQGTGFESSAEAKPD